MKSITTIIIIYALINIISIKSEECGRENPIKKSTGDTCQSIYCSNSQFESGECKIANSIIKTQWLNNIILVGEETFRYINFETLNNNKLFFYTSPYPYSNQRIIFGIDSHGDPIFKDQNNKDVYIYKKFIEEIISDDCICFESISGIIKVTDIQYQTKQYFVSISKPYNYVELFDFNDYESEIRKFKLRDQDIWIETYLGNIIDLNDNNFYVVGQIKIKDDNYYFFLIKFRFVFNESGNIVSEKIESQEYHCIDIKITYCYLSSQSNNIIICMYISDTKSFFIILFETSNLEEKYIHDLQIQYDSYFFKFLHWKTDLYFLTYFKKQDSNNYLVIQIIELEHSNDYAVNMKNEIILNKYNYITDFMLNDFILVRDDLLCFASLTDYKKALVIGLISFFNGINTIRYYFIDMYKLYKHFFHFDMKLYLYNKHIIIGFSSCNDEERCDVDYKYHSSLIFFSYPNITDYDLDIIDYLDGEEHNNITINLFDYINIDNNIFGLIIDEIKIISIDNCDIIFKSSETNKTINENDELRENEKLNLFFIGNEYERKDCLIKYRLIVTEPNYEEYNKYPNIITNENDEYFTKEKYEGKVGNYKIIINEELTNKCQDENYICDLCLKNTKERCLICKYNYDFNNDIKKCYSKLDNLLNGGFFDVNLTNEELKEVHWFIRNQVLNEGYDNDNIVIQTSNINFQISTLEDQKDSNLPISSIDLKDCEKILKKKIILKMKIH